MIHEATITYVGVDKNNNDKNVKENYIISSEDSFGLTENLLLSTFLHLPDLDVVAIKRSKIMEIINSREDEKDCIFVADIASLQYNEEGEDTERIYKVALFATCLEDAYAKVKEYLKQGYDMYVVAIKKTKIKDVLSQEK